MKDRKLEEYLRQSLRQEPNLPVGKHGSSVGGSSGSNAGSSSGSSSDGSAGSSFGSSSDGSSGSSAAGNFLRLEETVRLCIGVMREQRAAEKSWEEPRTGFVQYLSDVFRYDGISILGLHAAVLFIICMAISTVVDVPGYIPVFMPLFVLAAMPAMFRCQYYGMSEIEAVTRASGAQIILAKLILAGAVNLVCMTILISLEVYFRHPCKEIGQMILYCLTPYLVCMACVLRLIRLRRKENMQMCTVFVLSSCVFWGVLAKTMPWLYETSAFGIWIIAFLFFAVFFIREIYFIIAMRKEGKMYGIIA